MTRLLLRALQGAGALAVLMAVAALCAALFVAVRVASYRQLDDEGHLEAKRAYLAKIAESAPPAPDVRQARPNILLILFDDLGYGDLGAYGARSISTPRIDALAAAGLRLEQYYAPASVCTPSRAALLSGRYAPRAGLNQVVFPTGHPIDRLMRAAGTNVRIPAEEILLPEILSAAGYETAMVGKWHLGDESPSLPNDRDFDHYLGALYSNDMTPFAIYRDREIAHEAPFDQTRLTRVYTEAAAAFLDQERTAPFFLYYAHNFPHIPLAAPEADRARSRGGLYGDVVEGLDDSVGAILDVLARRGQLENTLVLLTSDNGPWYEGSPGAVRGRKNQTWEGGLRVPFIAHWPARIGSGRVSHAPVVGVDLVPTLLSLLGLPAPEDRMLDGTSLVGLLEGTSLPSDRAIHYFGTEQYDAIRVGRFKYHRRRGVRAQDVGHSWSFRLPQGPWLFDLELDPAESYDASQRYPEEVDRLAARFAAKQAEIRDNPRGWR